jgi:hypothetical protein
MRSNYWKKTECTKDLDTRQGPSNAVLEPVVQTTFSWSSRLFEISDLSVEKDRKDSTLVLTYQLDQLDGDSGNNQNPVHPIQLSLKAEAKEIGPLSGLLNRHCRVLELKQTTLVSQNVLLQELQELRSENERLRQEVQNLYGALDLIQRPKLIS